MKIKNVKRVRKARQDFLDNVEDGDSFDSQFHLTEKGMRYLEELRKKSEGQNKK